MKYAVISVSREGALLGQRVKDGISGEGTLYERKGAESGGEAVYFNRTLALTSDIFTKYEGLLFIMASGIAVRAVAPHVVSKASDPAVLVMDECGKHCISLLSGHLGGANAWARELMMRVEPLGALKPVNSFIAEGKRVCWFLDMETEGAVSIGKRLSEKGISFLPLSDLPKEEFEGCVIISNEKVHADKPFVRLIPKNLYVGIGCKRGTAEALIEDAFQKALFQARAYEYQVASLASVDAKADEKGLLDFAMHHHLPIHFYKAEELRKVTEDFGLPISKFVENTIGVGNVCQSAALMESMKGKTLLPKTKFASATVAIALGLSGSSALDRVTRRK